MSARAPAQLYPWHATSPQWAAACGCCHAAEAAGHCCPHAGACRQAEAVKQLSAMLEAHPEKAEEVRPPTCRMAHASPAPGLEGHMHMRSARRPIGLRDKVLAPSPARRVHSDRRRGGGELSRSSPGCWAPPKVGAARHEGSEGFAGVAPGSQTNTSPGVDFVTDEPAVTVRHPLEEPNPPMAVRHVMHGQERNYGVL